MNHLAHLALAGDDTALVVGGYLGDHVKGRLQGHYPREIETGIRLHRAIDAFTDSHPIVHICQSHFEPPYRRYSGIILDVTFDYFLAHAWQDYYEVELDSFSESTLTMLVDHAELMPPHAEDLARRMRQRNSLASHGDERYLQNSFTHLATRLSRANPMADAYEALLPIRSRIEPHFHAFYPELIDFCDNWKTENC